MRDRKEVKQMFEENMKLVPFTVNKYYPTFIYDDDIFQIGYIGLWQACKNFDESLNVKFSSYAVRAIRGEIIKYFRSLQMKKRCPPAPLTSLDYPVLDDDKTVSDWIIGAPFEWLDFEGFYNSLSMRQKLIVKMRVIDKASYQEIGDRCGVTRERIRQEMTKIKGKFDEYI